LSYCNNRLLEYREFLKGKSASVIGVGISNIPLIGFLLDNGVKVVARDMKTEEQLSAREDLDYEGLKGKGVSFVTGSNYLEGIDEDIVFKSPGVRFDEPQIADCAKRGKLVTSEMEAFISLCPSKIIAVTGSDGKTTTTTLVAKLLEASGKKVFLGGNIGKPLLSEIASISPEDFTVLELSSFQLHTVNRFENKGLPFAHLTFPDVGIITNVTPNHLNWHTDMEEYAAAKQSVYTNMAKGGVLVTNLGCERTAGYRSDAEARGLDVRMFSAKVSGGELYISDGAIYFKNERILNISDIVLPGVHNVENYMAAIGAVLDFVMPEDIRKVAATFGGVEHRLELVKNTGGVRYYNSSIDSTPTRPMAALSCFGSEYDGKIILILGGKDKILSFDELAKVVCKKAKAVIISHDTPEKKIQTAIENCKAASHSSVSVKLEDGFDNAVRYAMKTAVSGDIVLLSPALTSFDEFDNFEQRGKRFKSIIAG